MLEKFIQYTDQRKFWNKDSKVLLAVSGGLDSMVLLDLFRKLPEKKRSLFAVAHFNHQLRSVSDLEEAELKEFCEKSGISFFSEKWTVKEKSQHNIEARAREARYGFFFKLMGTHDFDVLVTAHHGDDQTETVLMKLIRGSLLKNLVGIREVSWRENHKIIRPLLHFSREDLEGYAKKENLHYWQDESNFSAAYLRNRVRQHMLPFIKRENTNYLHQVHNLVIQLDYNIELVEEYIAPKYQDMVFHQEGTAMMSLPLLLKESEAVRYHLLVKFLEENLVDRGVDVHFNHIQTLMEILTKTESKELHLSAGWMIIKSYDRLILTKETPVEVKTQSLLLGRPVEVADAHFLALRKKSDDVGAVTILDQIEIPVDCLPVIVRSFQEGDRFILDKSGQSKKVSRYFIDEKIPVHLRRKTPLVADKKGNILWIVGFRKSYLSIPSETDKIPYRLIYYKTADVLEGEVDVEKRYQGNSSK
ncbi:tRNA lysidine(34) synthetase TilS [Vagococcus elongatus]|uniref:tRNA(Ile)-lysidine synthase n=1 Tax=Vagococcus elongatus TaxID=180344 RepID=A0A430AHZ1_9ENTE|nr:tRNA lysidine(34) synthetase TilS [Vagococcus elongatus]RSU07623.1 tRNA lysidine(34) synthetase TilS [Vagococcus elongatus]